MKGAGTVTTSVTSKLTTCSRAYWGVNCLSAGHRLPRLLWNQNFGCSVHWDLPLVLILNEINPIHALIMVRLA